MDTRPLLTKERPLEMDPEDFRLRLIREVLPRDVLRDSSGSAARIVDPSGNCGGQQRGSAEFGYLPGHRSQSGLACLHHIVSASAVDVNVDKSRNRGLIDGANLGSAGGQ